MGSERMPPAIERKVGMSFLRAVRAMIFFLTKSGFTGSFDPVRVRLGRSCSDWQRKTRLGECRAGLEARSVDRLRFERRLGAVRFRFWIKLRNEKGDFALDLQGRDGRGMVDRKSTRLNSSHSCAYRMPSSA